MFYLNSKNLSKLDDLVLNKETFKISYKMRKSEITVFCSQKEEKQQITWFFRGFAQDKLIIPELDIKNIPTKEDCVEKIKEKLSQLS